MYPLHPQSYSCPFQPLQALSSLQDSGDEGDEDDIDDSGEEAEDIDNNEDEGEELTGARRQELHDKLLSLRAKQTRENEDFLRRMEVNSRRLWVLSLGMSAIVVEIDCQNIA